MTDKEIMNLSCSEKDKLGMLFGNHLTHGSEQGGLICVNEFNKIIDVLIKWKNSKMSSFKQPCIKFHTCNNPTRCCCCAGIPSCYKSKEEQT